MSTVTLATPTLVSPVVSAGTLSVDAEALPLQFSTTDLNTNYIIVTVGSIKFVLSGVSNSGATRFISGSVTIPAESGMTTLTYYGSDVADDTAVNAHISAATLISLLISTGTNVGVVRPPSGVKISRYPSACKVQWERPNDVNFLGVRVRYSTDSSGINPEFVQYGNVISMVTTTDKQNANKTFTSTVDNTANTQTDVTKSDIVYVDYSEVNIPSSLFPNGTGEFYVSLTAIVQDPDTKLIQESQANGPFKGGFIDLRLVNPLDFPGLQTYDEIATRMVAGINQLHPSLDLSPRSEIRDTIIDPVALEMSNLSIREWFSRVSQSISALATFDNQDGSGISDPVALSDYKSSVARAFGLDDLAMQDLVDRQFDILGEQVGLTRQSPTASVVDITFYTLVEPTKVISIPQGVIVATIVDENTPSLTFVTRGSAIIDPAVASSFYNPQKLRWEVTVPAESQSTGSISRAGAGSIRRVISGATSGVSCINDTPAFGGTDQELNSRFASRIRLRQVTGVDTGSRNGYATAALGTPGVVDVSIVSSGDLEMLRDWDPVREKHVYGTVDVYVRGNIDSEYTHTIPYKYTTTSTYGNYSTYTKLAVSVNNTSQTKFTFADTLSGSPVAVVEVVILGTPSATPPKLGVVGSWIDDSGTLHLDPNENASTGVKNYVVVQSLGSGTKISALVRLGGGINYTSSEQPVTAVGQVYGEVGLTGLYNPSKLRVLTTQDPLLYGGSTKAGDVIVSDPVLITKTVDLSFVNISSSYYIPDDGVVLDKFSNIVRLIKADGTASYSIGIDYTIEPAGRYGRYRLKLPVTTTIPLSASNNLKLAYNVAQLSERVIPVLAEQVKLVAYTPTFLLNNGFINDTWSVQSRVNPNISSSVDPALTLINDSELSGLAIQYRYIKVVYVVGGTRNLAQENKDYQITSNADGSTSVVRIPGTIIPDGATVEVTYLRNEIVTIKSRTPSVISMIVENINTSKHACADVLVKAMQKNKVDISMTIELDSIVGAETVDGKVRTVLASLIENTRNKLTQAEVIRQVKSISGVRNVIVPLTHMTKADGSYDIGRIIPTGSNWILGYASGSISIPEAYITRSKVLFYNTILSGGKANAYVGLMYEGDPFSRALDADGLLNGGPGTFLILSTGQVVLWPKVSTFDPNLKALRATYQIFGEVGSKDISISPTEYLNSGKVVINYTFNDKVAVR